MSQMNLVAMDELVNSTAHSEDGQEKSNGVDSGSAVQFSQRNRKLTTISMESEEKDNEEDEEKSDAPKSSKAQKLKEAILSGDANAVEKLLAQKFDVNDRDEYGRSALHNAVLKGDKTIVEILLGANADVNLTDDRNDTPLHFAARGANGEVMKLILSQSECEVNAKGSSLNSPLHLAASLNKPAYCKMLLEHGARLNVQEESGKTPLGRAVESGAKHSARFLFKHMENNNIPMDEFLYDADFDGTTLLHLSVDSGFVELVQLCLSYGSRIREPRRSDRSSAFHLACEQGYVPIVQYIVEKDPGIAKILLMNSEGTTPLHQAAKSNSHEIARILIDQGANVNSLDKFNKTPLMLASIRGATDTVSLLMEKGADPTLKDVDNRTAAFSAVGHSRTMAVLLQNPDLALLLTEKDLSGFSAPHYAAKRGDAKSMSLFLSHNKATASVLSDSLDTPLHVAAKYGCHDIIRVLLEKQSGKIVNAQNTRARTALHLACRGGHYRAAGILIENGATIEKDQTGRTPLHEAAQNGSKKTVEKIIEKHIHCLNYKDEDKNTALHLAVIFARRSIISFLLSLSRQEILQNSSNRSILDAAMELETTVSAMAIVEHYRWREVLECCNTGVSKIFKQMVIKMPAVAERIMDNCIESEGDKSSDDYKVKYDLSILLRKSDPNNSSSMEIMEVIADNRRENCLTHQLSFIVLCTKWNLYGWLAFTVNILSVLSYMIPLTVIHITLEEDDERYCPDRINWTSTGEIIYLLDVKTCHQNHTTIQIGQYVMLAIILVQLVREMFEIRRKKLQYFTMATNYLELTAFVSAIISIVPTCECKWGYQKQAAAVACFVGWINMIMYLQGLPFYGKYVIMLYRMFVTLLKVMMLFLLFAFAFGTTFHLVLDQDPFTTLPNIMMNMFIMTLGELNYSDIFMPWSKLYYPYMSNLFLVLFCLTMPIILMNMLVGLSVGDIDKIEQSALIDRYILQVDLLNSLENTFPAFILRRIQKQKSVIIYPNKQPSVGKVIFDALIGFGQAEELADEDEGETLPETVKEMHDKLEEQSQTIDEMRVTITQMFEMMKQREAAEETKSTKRPGKTRSSLGFSRKSLFGDLTGDKPGEEEA